MLTLWILGMTLVRSCATSQLAGFWSEANSHSFNVQRQCLREFYLDASEHGIYSCGKCTDFISR